MKFISNLKLNIEQILVAYPSAFGINKINSNLCGWNYDVTVGTCIHLYASPKN